MTTAADLVGTAPAEAPLATALAAFQAEMPTVPKTQTAQIPGRDGKSGYSYKYADLADVVSAALPLMTAQGLSFSTCPRWTDHGLELVGVLLHTSGESMEGALPIAGGTPQALGSSITYARRYLFGCMTGVVTDADDDGRAASSAPPRKRAASTPKADDEDGKITTKQTRLMGALMRELKITDRAAALDYVAQVVGRTVGSRNELTTEEASDVIDALQTRGATDFRRTVEAPPRTPVDPWATREETPETPSVQESAGPPGPADQDAEYRARVREEARRSIVDLEDIPLPLDGLPEGSDTTPVVPSSKAPAKPPAAVSPGTVRRIENLLRRELGDIATEAEKAELMGAILGTPVASVEAVTRDQSLKLAQAFDHFREGTWSWSFDVTDTSPTPRILVTTDVTP